MSSTSFDQMSKDKRYAAKNEVPDEVLAHVGSEEIFSPGFSIKGQALNGRASYLVRGYRYHRPDPWVGGRAVCHRRDAGGVRMTRSIRRFRSSR